MLSLIPFFPPCAGTRRVQLPRILRTILHFIPYQIHSIILVYILFAIFVRLSSELRAHPAFFTPHKTRTHNNIIHYTRTSIIFWSLHSRSAVFNGQPIYLYFCASVSGEKLFSGNNKKYIIYEHEYTLAPDRTPIKRRARGLRSGWLVQRLRILYRSVK